MHDDEGAADAGAPRPALAGAACASSEPSAPVPGAVLDACSVPAPATSAGDAATARGPAGATPALEQGAGHDAQALPAKDDVPVASQGVATGDAGLPAAPGDASPAAVKEEGQATASTSGARGTRRPRTPPPPTPPELPAYLRDVRPAYFYGDDGSTCTDPVEARGVPVFEPTIEQFSDFYAFCQAIDRWGMQTGIVKVVPPREWLASLPPLRVDADAPLEHASLRRVKIRQAITQHFLPAGPGRWKQTNVTRAKPYDVKQWADLCATPQQRGPPLVRVQRQAAAQEAAEQAHARSRLYEPSVPPSDGGPARRLTRSGGQGLDVRAVAPRAKRADGPTSEAAWAAFDYERAWLDEARTDEQRARGEALDASLYDARTCRAIEGEYWRTLNMGQPPMYGADQQGTLFDARTTQWNIGTLDSLLSRTLACALPGVTTPYLYFGMWRASFAWHVEDMDLYSINYVHFGAPKQWYAIRQADRARFESVMAAAFPADARKCAHFLRHKSFLVSPSVLASQGIHPLRLVQHAHEIVLTYPYGYHSGYNLGFNCAESVNFALPSWIEIGRKAEYCRCPLAQESVHIDMDVWWPAEAPSKKPRAAPPAGRAAPAPRAAAASPREKECLFCPRSTSDALVPLPSAAASALRAVSAARVSCDATAAPWHAHQLCACFLPECWVSHDPACAEVQGAADIDRARWGLKCQVCDPGRDARHGCKIQCTKGKCVRAAHVSCALDASSGWFMDYCAPDVAARLDGGAPDGADERLVVLCRAHNPLRREAEALQREEAWAAKVAALACPAPVAVKLHGAVWSTMLRRVDAASKTVYVDAADDTPALLALPWTKLVLDDARVQVTPLDRAPTVRRRERAASPRGQVGT